MYYKGRSQWKKQSAKEGSPDCDVFKIEPRKAGGEPSVKTVLGTI